MGWFKRTEVGITTETKDKKETPDGLWHKCPKCKVIVSVDDHAAELWTCGNCGHHDRINAKEYFHILFDNGVFTELDALMESKDPLKFEDTKPYVDRLKAGQKKSGL
ncbi:MAG TPA: acetyl-CoA carboxylase carboxyl transferase subunit beta, partial [Cryomorphaceae bacterium]|nr:acetyl-CoA carboxylase carboxyl transferase subunit beta [Cryomorphaceae bacterium]